MTAIRRSGLPAWPSWEPSDPSGLQPDGPPWIAFGHCVTAAQPPVWLSQEPPDLSELNSDSPLWLSCEFLIEHPLRLICRMDTDYCILCASVVYCSFYYKYSFILFSMIQFCIIKFFCSIVSSFGYCSINFLAIDHFLILELYSRYFNPANWWASPVSSGNKHHSSQDPRLIHLSIGCHEGRLPQ